MNAKGLEEDFDNFIKYFKDIPSENILKELELIGVTFSDLKDCEDCIKETAKD